MGYGLEGRPTIGQVPLLIFAYLGISFLISGFILTVLAYAPSDSYIMTMMQNMGVANFIGPIVLIIGTIMVFVSVFYCCWGTRQNKDDDYYDDED